MSKVQILRALLKQRLPADDEEEIFELLERTAAEYEEELCGLEEENERQRKLLEAALNSDDKTDVQQLLVKEAEVPPEQQAWTSSLDQKDPELCYIKKEEAELWTCEEREHLQVLEINSSMYANDDVKTHSSDCHQLQSEENREAEALASSSIEQMKTNDKEDWEGSEPAGRFNQDSYFHSHSDAMISHFAGPESDVSGDDWKETKEPNSGLNSLKYEILPVCDNRCNAGVKPFSPECDQRIVLQPNLMTYNSYGIHTGEKLFRCSECCETFKQNSNLKTHMMTHMGKKTFKCSECGKTFNQSSSRNRHMLIHTGERLFSCSLCEKTFNRNSSLKTHMLTHTGERPFSCSECPKTFHTNSNLKSHMQIHTGKKTFKCSKCGKEFPLKGNLKRHMTIHMGMTPFMCFECGKTFNQNSHLKIHMLIHTGERPFSCSECGKTFNKKTCQKTHMLIHTGERPFSCPECGKTFNRNGNLQIHLLYHTGERPFSCSMCGKAFAQSGDLKRHMTTHMRHKPFKCVKGSGKVKSGDVPSRKVK